MEKETLEFIGIIGGIISFFYLWSFFGMAKNLSKIRKLLEERDKSPK